MYFYNFRKIEPHTVSTNQHNLTHESQMDYPDPKRRKKSDKAKEKYERNGGFSQKHVRATEALLEKRSATSSSKHGKKN
jgi:hypothetical protein